MSMLSYQSSQTGDNIFPRQCYLINLFKQDTNFPLSMLSCQYSNINFLAVNITLSTYSNINFSAVNITSSTYSSTNFVAVNITFSTYSNLNFLAVNITLSILPFQYYLVNITMSILPCQHTQA